MKDRLFQTLQRLGKTFMLPIALLPVAGLFLGLGASLTGDAFLELYNLQSAMGEGTLIYKILAVLRDSGSVIFGNLPMLFAIAVALGFAQKEKAVAALSATVGYFVMNAALQSSIANFMNLETLQATPGLITANYLGFENTMNTGVLGGIILGLIVSVLHNRFYKIELPEALSLDRKSVV